MYQPPPTAKELSEMAAAGLTPEDFATGDVDLWPENEPVYFLFCYMQTQWRAGAMGATGLDYNVLHAKMGRMKLSADEFDELEADIQVMEYAALAAMSGRGFDEDQQG
jgi:hypothetical protein